MSDASIVTKPIVSTVVGPAKIAAEVKTTSTPAAGFTGGVGQPGPQGPQGPQGIPGPAIDTLDQLSDVVAPAPADGEVLRYVGGAWRDVPNSINGGNF